MRINKHNAFMGLTLILIAILIILNQFGYFTGINAFDIVVTAFMVTLIILSLKELIFGDFLSYRSHINSLRRPNKCQG